MSGELGQLSLCLALALAIVMAGAGIVGTREHAARARRVATSATLGFAVFIALAFGLLTYAFIVSDFTIYDVASNSSTMKPLIYKITGVWGNHEGSMLLWMLVLAIFSAAAAFAQAGSARRTSGARGVQGLLAVAFLLFILFTSNPFLRLDPPPFEGSGMNPLLQDPGLAMHPPMLYIGYVGLSATFAYAASALIAGDREAHWARAARPFMLAAWIALTLGITLGSWWAYYDLGWGGFWFWDPVENAALMPWLVATALLHSALATERNGAFRTWTLLLAIGAFSLSLIGTFLVRSGVLTSVHSFAVDPERGEFILIILGLAIGGALALFAWRAPKLESGATFGTVSRESALLFNNVLLTAAMATVFIGTLYPLFLDAWSGTRISVGPPYFAITFAPIFVALLILVPFGPRLPWSQGDLKAVLRALAPAAGLAAVGFIVVAALAPSRAILAGLIFALALWVIGASAVDLWTKRKSRGLTAASLAAVLAHAGLGVTLMGVAGTTLWRAEALDVLRPGDSLSVGGYQLRLDDVEDASGSNWRGVRATLSLIANRQTVATLAPEKREFPNEDQSVTDTAIRTTGYSDIYVALGDQRGSGWTIRAYVNPLAPFIWFGGAIMALGGIAAFLGRIRARTGARVAAAVPAE